MFALDSLNGSQSGSSTLTTPPMETSSHRNHPTVFIIIPGSQNASDPSTSPLSSSMPPLRDVDNSALTSLGGSSPWSDYDVPSSPVPDSPPDPPLRPIFPNSPAIVSSPVSPFISTPISPSVTIIPQTDHGTLHTTNISVPSINLPAATQSVLSSALLVEPLVPVLDISDKEQHIQEAIRAIKASGLKAGSTTEYSLSLQNAAKNFDVPCQTLKDHMSG